MVCPCSYFVDTLFMTLKMFYATYTNKTKIVVSYVLVIYYNSLFNCVYLRVVTEMEVQFINFKNRIFYEDRSW